MSLSSKTCILGENVVRARNYFIPLVPFEKFINQQNT